MKAITFTVILNNVTPAQLDKLVNDHELAPEDVQMNFTDVRKKPTAKKNRVSVVPRNSAYRLARPIKIPPSWQDDSQAARAARFLASTPLNGGKKMRTKELRELLTQAGICQWSGSSPLLTHLRRGGVIELAG